MERAYLPPARSWQPLVELALEEDIGPGDATTPVVVEIGRRGEALIEARQQLVVCGLDVAAAVFHALDVQASGGGVYHEGVGPSGR